MGIIPNITYVQCDECKSWTTPGFQIHYCVYRKEGKLVSKMKRWNATLGCWQVDRPTPRILGPGDSHSEYRGLATYNTKTGEWDKDDSEKAKGEDKYEVSSCEIGPKQVGKNESSKGVTTTTGYTANNWEPAKPWEGIDRLRWPETWMKLVQMYFTKDYWGKYISNEEYRDRILRGIYKPEVKTYYGDWDNYGYPNYQSEHYKQKAANKTPDAVTDKPDGQDPGDEENPYGFGV